MFINYFCIAIRTVFCLKFTIRCSIVAIIDISAVFNFIAWALNILANSVIFFIYFVLVAHFALEIVAALIIIDVFWYLIRNTSCLFLNLRLDNCRFNYIRFLFGIIFQLLLGLSHMLYVILLSDHHRYSCIFLFALFAVTAYSICFVKFIYCLTFIA